MCGIAGLIDPTWARLDPQRIEAMTRTLAPRGPDGEGFFHAPGVALGHRRLAVIDLTDNAAQPLANEDGSVQVVFNGEIYNFQELRADLLARGHVFRSHGDTEVLVHGYEEWGDELLPRLDGMFAFAIWDAQRRRLLAARDRMGKKPLYFASVARQGAPPLFAFASELKALLTVPGFDRSIDPEALCRYLVHEYVPPPHSIFRGARKLAAGERLRLEIKDGSACDPRVDRYWELSFAHETRELRDDDAAALLREHLLRSVRRRLVADVPVGIFLSGGIDSSTVTAFAAQAAGAENVHTFSVGFSEGSFDESSHARRVAGFLGTHHREERLGVRTLLDILPVVGDFLDEPFADASVVPTYLLSRFARRHVTVALGGDGGDELFAGYQTFLAEAWGRLFFDRTPAALQAALAAAARLLPARSGYFSLDFKVNQFLQGGNVPGPRRHQRWLASFLPEQLPSLLTADLARALPGDPLAAVDARARLGPASAAWDRLLDFYARFYLPDDVNTKVDRAASAVGLEVRAPFLDTALIDFACSLPAHMRLRWRSPKFILKRAMRGRLPKAILGRSKQGFAVPVARWMREDLAPALRDELAPEKLRREGCFEPSFVEGLLGEHLSGRRDRRKALWTLFVFERWRARWAAGR
ncbi:MAG: asparagine synthase (glutamine-hydrolyzing) [Deltaproteobacteria bacterium]|nr:asparagine synthase (glutamine-hydrolyzing) [Deltaproteobacteria bacterium]